MAKYIITIAISLAILVSSMILIKELKKRKFKNIVKVSSVTIAGVLALSIIAITTQNQLLQEREYIDNKEKYYEEYEKKLDIPEKVYYAEDVVIDFGPDFEGQELKIDTTKIGKHTYKKEAIDKDKYIHTFEFQIIVEEEPITNQPILKKESLSDVVTDKYIKFPDGNIIQYDNVGAREGMNYLEDNPNKAVTWTFNNLPLEHRNNDGKPTYFLGYEFGAFKGLSEIKLNDEILVHDGNSEDKYVVTDIYQLVLHDEEGHDLNDILELDDESIIMQTTIDDKNMTVVAKHITIIEKDHDIDKIKAETA